MSDYAIRVEGLGKRYRLGLQDNAAGGMYRYKSLRDSLGGLIKHPVQAARGLMTREPMDEQNSFWALNDVNFEVKRGEVVGIIGRNGAGKSTLLKILSRITKPTTGHIELRGRVGSLLEVGTGFHPELTGRENIYLNGAILGMTRAEVRGKFDEIVAFSEIEKFLDTPVKQYSSGMYMRLAFAVAANLESEILVVDEVLAVGDAEFQKRCLGKMKSVAVRGKTVLFVSHNMGAVIDLCAKAIVLQNGQEAFCGDVGPAVECYLRSARPGDATIDLSSMGRASEQSGPASLESVFMEHSAGAPAWTVPFKRPIHLRILIRIRRPISGVEVGASLSTLSGFEVLSSVTTQCGPTLSFGSGMQAFDLAWDVPLAPGTYFLSLGIRGDRGMIDYLPDSCTIDIVPSPEMVQKGLHKTRGVILSDVHFYPIPPQDVSDHVLPSEQATC